MSHKIFIIEDDENILYGLQEKFSSDGYEVEMSDADDEMDDLIARIKKSQPDYIILDLLLPKHDGLELLKRLKNDPELSDSQVLIFTDLSDEDSKSRSIGLGANYYFLKSEMDVYSFADKVESIISEKKVNDEDENDLVME